MSEISTNEMAKLAIKAIEDKKAEDITIIDISEISTISDYFIICSGNNHSQIQAICDSIDEMLGRNGINAKQVEGYESAAWVLMDYRDIIIHVFDKQNRLYYDLERIWRDGKKIEINDL